MLMEEEEYLVLKVVGFFELMPSIGYIIEAHQMGQKRGIEKYLIDLTEAQNSASVTDLYNYAYKVLAEAKVKKTPRSVLLVNKEDHSFDFLETVMRNNGYNIKLFRDLCEGKNFLTKGNSSCKGA